MNDKVANLENKMLGGFEVEYDGNAVAQFFYCTEWDERGFMARDAAKKLATKIAHKIEKSTIIETEKGFKLVKPKRNNNDQR